MTDSRLFFALWPDAEVRQALARLQHGAPKGRGVHAADLHMTLVFLGAWPQERQPCLLKAAARVRAEPFELILDHTELWRRPRIFCAAPANSPNALRQLVEQLNEYLPDCGFSPEKRPFAPHVSLVRKAMSAERRVLRQPICWQVKDFVLAQSSPGGPPPRYRVVDRWALREA